MRTLLGHLVTLTGLVVMLVAQIAIAFAIGYVLQVGFDIYVPNYESASTPFTSDYN